MNKVITVVKPESTKMIHLYAKIVNSDIIEEVEEAFEELEIDVEPEIVEDIANALERGRNYWYDEQYCFEIIKPHEIIGVQHRTGLGGI